MIAMAPGCNSGTVLQLGKPMLQRHRHRRPIAKLDQGRTGSIPPSAAGERSLLRASRNDLNCFGSFGGSAFPSWVFRHNRISVDYLPSRTCGRMPKTTRMRLSADMRRATASRGFQGPLV